jgi:hypothetical protein
MDLRVPLIMFSGSHFTLISIHRPWTKVYNLLPARFRDKSALNSYPQVLGTPAGAVKKEETLLGRVFTCDFSETILSILA